MRSLSRASCPGARAEAPIAPGSISLPFLQIGDSDGVRAGDPLTVVGFPGIGGNTVSISSGQVSGFLGDARLGDRAWIKTDAVVSQGNSGGLAANNADQLVGLPTRANPEDTGGYSLVRPIALVQPMIDDALAGRPSLDSRYSVPSPGTEQFTFDTWTEPVQDCQAGIPVTSYPSGVREIRALFDYAGVVDGEDLLIQLSVDGEPALRGIVQFPAGTTGTENCYAAYASIDRGFPDAVYTFDLFVGPTLRQVGSATTVVGAATASPGAVGGSTVFGRVIDVDSGQPIPGAVVFVLKPGTDPAAWARSPDSAALVSYGQAGADGRFQLPGLTGGTSYPVIVLAEGYHGVMGGIGPVPEGESDLASDIRLLRAGP